MVHGMRGRPPAVRAGQRMQAGTLLRQALTQALTQRAAAAWQRAYARAVSGPSQPVQGGGSEGGGPVRQARGIAPPHPPHPHTRARMLRATAYKRHAANLACMRSRHEPSTPCMTRTA